MGNFISVDAADEHMARRALRKAEQAAEAYRPTRVVLILPRLTSVTSHRVTSSCAHWVGLTASLCIVLIQNELAEAVSPCFSRVRELQHSLRMDVRDCRWNWRGLRWPELEAGAWCLNRASRVPGRPLEGWRRVFDIGQDEIPEDVPPTPSGTPHARRHRAVKAIRAANLVPAYARRLGVIPSVYADALGYAIEVATGERPSLKTVTKALTQLRESSWDMAAAAFRHARAARSWVYTSDPSRAINNTEEDRRAQWLYLIENGPGDGGARGAVDSGGP